VENRKEIELDFEIDKLTNSIENTNSGDSFPTEISLLDISEIKEISYKNGWQFNWEIEFKIPSRSVYKLTIAPNSKIIQGLVSLEVKSDHVYMHLIESAPLNIGNQKTYLGVPGNLVAFACKLSFQNGGEGYVSFLSKSKLVVHYEKSLGAIHFGGNLMIISSEAAFKLISKYFK
jgi:hypothetical protein